MVPEKKRLLKVFLCHASGDKPPVRDLYKRLTAEGVDAWLDKEKLLPGQDWRMEIPKAVREADVVVVCLSNKSITKEGYVQKEIKFALDIAEEKPEGTIFLIPARLEDCVVPERLSRWHWVDLYEENGFIQLLRSLKLRAEAVDAAVEPALYVDSDKETDRRLEQWYTEGLAAFYTEDWDRACQRFQSILSERPNHKNASEKLEEAERQRHLSKLYEQASAAVRSGDWGTAIQTLEELSHKSADYKDAAQLLRNARRQKQLRELYAEAKSLHAAQQWEAVVRVFEQINVIEPNYPDADGLLPSAQKEVAELKRIANLNDQYSHALHEMETGNWYEARRLLESVHKSETGFLETEKLLRKVENEISQEEEKRKQNDQINTLYEQAHGLLRSKKWRNALSKMEEIRKLDDHFPDADGIAEKAQKELEREEQEAERQNKLAALYAEAVKLLKEEKYQEALDKWGEVRAVDPKYPDRQWVGRTAKKELAKQTKPVQVKRRFVISWQLWMGIVGLIVVGAMITGVILSVRGNQGVSPVSTKRPTQTSAVRPANPTATKVPGKTNTPRPATPVPATGGYSDPTMYDDFSNSAYDGKFNTVKWGSWGIGSISQSEGILAITTNGYKHEKGIGSTHAYPTSPMFIEARMMLDPSVLKTGTNLDFELSSTDNNNWTNCGIGTNGNTQMLNCKDYSAAISPGAWHIIRIELYPGTTTFKYFVDGREVGYDTNGFKSSALSVNVGLNNHGSATENPIGYVDYVRIGAIDDDPTVYDSFDNVTYDGRFDPNLWGYDLDAHSLKTESEQQDGLLVITQSGIDQTSLHTLNDYWGKRFSSNTYIEASFKVEMSSDGVISLSLLDSSCGLHTHSNWVDAYCWDTKNYKSVRVLHGTWHTFRIEINIDENVIKYFVDGEQFGENQIKGSLKSTLLYPCIAINSGANRVENTRPVVAYADNVRVGPLEYINP